jgi:long-chain acyl-CoA synthetase
MSEQSGRITSPSEPAVSTVVDIVRRGRDHEPAITFEGRTISFGELDERSSRTAQALRAAGVVGGDRVAFLAKNRPEYFDIVLGAAKLGAVCVAVNWRLSWREIGHVLRDAHARVLFVGGELASTVEAIEDELGTMTIVALDPHPGLLLFDEWIAAHEAIDPEVESSADSVALQLYTSGTTGLPKGAMLTNRNLFAMVRAAGPAWGFRPGMTSLGVSPLFHIAGSGWNLMVLAYGGHVVLHREVDAEAILRDIPRYGVTHAILVPAILQMLVTRRSAGADAATLETVVYGASPISDDVLLALFDAFDCDFVQGYGLTETSGAVTVLSAEDHDRSRPELLRSCGHPLPGVELRIVDPDSGVECADGAVGEVLIRSEQVMAGYWLQPDATAEAISSDGWFRSGDAGYLRDGRLYLHDRIKDMIVSGAENVYPAEVENVLMRHPAIVDVAVIGVPDERWGETVKAVVVLADGTSLTADEVITHARADLARYKCPTSVDFVAELPRNPSGKVLKRELREPYWTGRDRRVS